MFFFRGKWRIDEQGIFVLTSLTVVSHSVRKPIEIHKLKRKRQKKAQRLIQTEKEKRKIISLPQI